VVFFDRRTSSVLLTVLLFVPVLPSSTSRAVIAIFVLSILFAYLINPIVRFLQGRSLFFKNLRGPHVV
jgi:predicted PurR-regulated permease PerM